MRLDADEMDDVDQRLRVRDASCGDAPELAPLLSCDDGVDGRLRLTGGCTGPRCVCWLAVAW